MEAVSIIVPVYRVEKWLRQCVDSILSQSFRDFHLILVDDGSPDGCSGICEEYARRDARVTVIHQPNRGVSAARNAGLARARGKYVTFCDADDFWAAGHLEQLVTAAEASGADMVSCNYLVVDEAGNFLDQAKHPAGLLDLETEEARVEYLLENVLSGKTGWAVWARLFSRDMLRNGSIRFCESCGGFGEDLNFVLQCCLHVRRVRALVAPTYRYRRRPGSAMGRTENRLNCLNESAYHFAGCFDEVITSPRLRERFPRIHLGMLGSGYEALPTAQIPGEVAALTHRDFFSAQLAALLRCPETGGKERAFLRFLRHGSILRYRLERFRLRLKFWRNP